MRILVLLAISFYIMLYKFHTINEYLYHLLVDQTLWFSQPSEFNDPFDAQFKLSIKVSEEEKLAGLNQLLDLYKQKGMYVNTETVIAHYTPRLKSIDIDETVSSELTMALQKFGICCFSKKYQNILMWSHYTNGHKGICLGFDFSNDTMIQGWTEEVHYSNNYIHASNAIEAKRGLTTKSPCWKYEKEVRIINKTPGIVKYQFESLKQIIFGAKTPEADIQRIIKLTSKVGGHKIKFKKAKMQSDKYSLEFVTLQ